MKQRSPRFPFITLEEATELLRKLGVHQSDRSKPLKRPEILKALDYSSLHGAAVKTVGALRAYDLLAKNGDGLSVTPTGATLLDESDGPARLAALQRAALSPLAFRNIWRRARHISKSDLAAALVDRGFTEGGAKRAAKVYWKNSKFAELETLAIEPELPHRGESPQTIAKRKQAARKQAARKRAARKVASRKVAARQAAPQNSTVDVLRLPLGKGVASIPKGMTEEEFQLLIQTLRAWKGQLVKG